MSEYGDIMAGLFAGGCVMNTLAMARELGVAKYLQESTAPVTSQQIADKLDLKERYVREMLASLATAQVISVDETSKLFHVPSENKTLFQTMSVFARFMPLFGERYPALKKCFLKSGPAGIQYTDFPAIFDVLEEVLVIGKEDIIDLDILPVVPNLKQNLENGIDVAEFGAATCIILHKLAARFPKSSFTGSDVGLEPLNVARARAEKENLTNTEYQLQDLDSLPSSMNEKFDWVFTRDVIHDLPNPQKSICQIYKSVKPGGFYSMIDVGMSGDVHQDVGDKWSAVYYSLSTYFCVPESYQRPESAAVGAGWGRPLARKILTTAGFTILTERVSDYDPKEVHFVCLK